MTENTEMNPFLMSLNKKMHSVRDSSHFIYVGGGERDVGGTI